MGNQKRGSDGMTKWGCFHVLLNRTWVKELEGDRANRAAACVPHTVESSPAPPVPWSTPTGTGSKLPRLVHTQARGVRPMEHLPSFAGGWVPPPPATTRWRSRLGQKLWACHGGTKTLIQLVMLSSIQSLSMLLSQFFFH